MPDQEDRDTLPGDPTEPDPPPPATDTVGVESASDPVETDVAEPEEKAEPENDPEPVAEEEAPSEPLAVPPQPEAVPGSYQYLKRWTFVLVVAAVWIFSEATGVGLFYWWYHAIDKTPAVFVVMLFLVVCTVCGLIAAMVQNKPLISALAIGLISAPFAATAAAAVLHGAYYCEYASHCLVGLIPY